MAKKKVKSKIINLNLEDFKDKKASDLAFKKAAKIVVKEITAHFKADSWPLDYRFLVNDIFQKAMGHNLESYLINELIKSRSNLQIVARDGSILIKQLKKTKKAKK